MPSGSTLPSRIGFERAFGEIIRLSCRFAIGPPS
jgi:hypothetical protein